MHVCKYTSCSKSRIKFGRKKSQKNNSEFIETREPYFNFLGLVFRKPLGELAKYASSW